MKGVRLLTVLYTSFVFDNGSSRTRLPVAAKTALYRAGAIGGRPGSPTPAGGASLFTMCMSMWRGARSCARSDNCGNCSGRSPRSSLNFAEQRQTRAKDCRSLELVADVVGADGGSGVDRGPHIWNVHLSPAVDFDLNHGRNISQEAAVRCDPQPRPLPMGLLPHPDFSAAISTTRRRRAVSSGYCLASSASSPLRSSATMRAGPIRSSQILDRIFLGVVRQFVGERVNRESMINVGHAAQPSDAT